MILKKYSKIVCLAALLVLMCSTWGVAQKKELLQQTIEVEKDYQPIKQQFKKIDDVPVIQQSAPSKSVVNTYEFAIPPVVAASFADAPVQATRNAVITNATNTLGWLKAGVGNYTTWLGDFYLTPIVLSNKTTVGLHLKDFSSNGSIKLNGGNRVKAPLGNTQLEVFGKHRFLKSFLEYNVDYTQNRWNYYGYDGTVPTVLQDNVVSNYFGSRQYSSQIGFNVRLSDLVQQPCEQRYTATLQYHNLSTKTKQNENFAEAGLMVTQPFKGTTLWLNSMARYYQINKINNRVNSTATSHTQILFGIQPGISLERNQFLLKASLKNWFLIDNDDQSKLYIAPHVDFTFYPVVNSKFLALHAGIDGEFMQNYYSSVLQQNRFVNPLLDAQNSFKPFQLKLGVSGKFDERMGFHAQLLWQTVKRALLFYQQEKTNNLVDWYVDNTFYAINTRVNTTTLHADAFYNIDANWQLNIAANLNSYTVAGETKAWNMPLYNLQTEVVYKPIEKLRVSANLNLTKWQQARIVNVLDATLNRSKNLPLAFDLNLSGTYSLRNNLELFADLNNIAFQRYRQWNGYRVLGFNGLVGLTWRF